MRSLWRGVDPVPDRSSVVCRRSMQERDGREAQQHAVVSPQHPARATGGSSAAEMRQIIDPPHTRLLTGYQLHSLPSPKPAIVRGCNTARQNFQCGKFDRVRHFAMRNDVRFAPKSGHHVSYSITSSARASSEGGTDRPRAFAVLRLMTRSNLVGVCTGRSAGFSPLRMRST